jgi:hypothetical protein
VGRVVLQDVWHAMGRVIKTMSKGNFDYWSALGEFKKIFARLRDGECSPFFEVPSSRSFFIHLPLLI